MLTPELLDDLEGRLTFRQFDYWLRTGAIALESGSTPGSGNYRLITDDEAEAIEAMVKVREFIDQINTLFMDGSLWAELMRQRKENE